MSGRQFAILCSVFASILGVAWACSIGSPVAYGAAPANWWNNLQTVAGSLLGGGGAISTIVLVLKKLGVPNVDVAADAVKEIIADYRSGKPIEVAEDSALLAVLMARAKAKDAAGSELATKLAQHVWSQGKMIPAEQSK